jgi:hypothetical protein
MAECQGLQENIVNVTTMICIEPDIQEPEARELSHCTNARLQKPRLETACMLQK